MTKTILIVDDEPEILSVLCEALAGMDLKVLSARDGQSAWELMNTTEPDIIVSDLRMPRLNGKDLFDMVKSHSSTQHIPFIFMSATPEAVLSIGAYAVLQKPFQIQGLINEVSSALKLAD